jgi:hypothetical protein
MRRLLDVEGARAGLVHLDRQVVSYAFLVWGETQLGGLTSWVTQLVVHEDYRNRKVATRLLHAAWGLSDQFAWGLATANPYAVRALEAATRRPFDPRVTLEHLEHLRRFTADRINYFRDVEFHVAPERSNVNTSTPPFASTMWSEASRRTKTTSPCSAA